MHLAGFELSGLINRRIDAGVGDEFFGCVKALDVADLGQQRRAGRGADAGDRGEMLRHLSHELRERVIDELTLLFQ